MKTGNSVSPDLFAGKSGISTKATAIFKPEGFWRGSANILHVGIFNRRDGSSRIYFRLLGLDNTGTMIGNGIYTIHANSFKAAYEMNAGNRIYVESTVISQDQISGRLFSSIAKDIVEFKITKQ